MEPDRWQEVERIYHAAMQCEESRRSAFLEQACAGDLALRAEVESLLQYGQSPAKLLDTPALEVVAHRLAENLRAESGDGREQAIGGMIEQYRIIAKIGAGGMGEVYRARDSRLGRDVAIKILPSVFSSDSERLRRFEQEARAAAALNHPNILAVHQMGTYEGAPYIVSELLEGETLRETIKRGPLSARKVMDYGVQIARGLAAAHEKGVVHRDLKPENLFVTNDGRVKILDFGLAKLTRVQSESDYGSPSLDKGTEAGVVMGTVGYMAPEQVRGETADHRADIFGYGAILYEMLAGKRAFEKPTSPETMTAILNEDPPGISQITATPAMLRIVHRCLEKNPEQRFQSASDLAFALDALSDSGASSHSAKAANAGTNKIRRWRIVAPAAMIVLALSIGGYFYFHRRPKLTDKDTIVLADFANSTGDAIFDDTLRTALNISLRQSPFLNVLSDGRIAQTLKLMAQPASTRLTPEIARELCQRAGSKAYIGGAIGSLGNEYVLGLKAVNCQSGDMLAEEQVTAKSKQEVLGALGQAASRLRGELGESLATVLRFDVPLVQATTSSLEALKAYGLGIKAHNEKGPAAALPYDLHAIELDPTFAVGYAAMGNDYGNLGEMGRASEYYTKAFQLREHASQQEELHISAFYYQTVTGELDKAAESYKVLIESYPRASASYDNFGLVLAGQGQFVKAAEITRQGMRLAAYDQAAWHANLANYTIALQRLDEARQIIHEAQARKLDIFVMHNALYGLAFLGGDSAAMAQQQQWFAGKPEENFGLALASDTEAYGGRLAKARDLTKRTVDSAIRADSKESGAIAKAIAAQREAVFGNAAKARQIAAEALQLVSTSQAVESEAGLAFAIAGDATRAESLAQDLGRRFPLDTQMQSLWLPAIRAQLALDRKNPDLALNTLQVTSPLELASIPFVNNISCLYPTYIRGEAYLAAQQSSAAAAEFQKIIDHNGIVWNCWTGALAHLGLARAHALQSRTSQGADADAARARSLAAYKDFLTLWKDADPDIPILKQAKAEYAKLQ